MKALTLPPTPPTPVIVVENKSGSKLELALVEELIKVHVYGPLEYGGAAGPVLDLNPGIILTQIP